MFWMCLTNLREPVSFQMINEYLQNTHAATHNQYKMQIEDVFELEKESEAEQFIDHSNK